MKEFESKFDARLDSLVARRTPQVERVIKASRYPTLPPSRFYQASPSYEVYQRMGEHGSAVRYAVGAMQPVDPNYTEITYGEGQRVLNQLSKFLNGELECDYEYQGSVTNDTHIKAYSDIDLLAIIRKFVTVERPQEVTTPYEGNPNQDLGDVREKSDQQLRSGFPKADVDDSGAKSISISGGSLQRKIDVVPANWFNTNQYAQYGEKRFRAVQILDTRSGCRLLNMPFMHNYRIEEKDNRVGGGLRKAARLLKSLKYDSDSVNLSSYDIVALAYNMNDAELITYPGLEIQLIARTKGFLDNVAEDAGLRESLMVPDESRTVFAKGHATQEGLDQLRDEVDDLLVAISKNLSRDFKKLAEARVSY